MLEKQCNLYSVDTGHFYSNHEKYLHKKLNQIKQERSILSAKLQETLSENEYSNLTKLLRHKKEKEKCIKAKLLTLLANKVTQNNLTTGKDHMFWHRDVKAKNLFHL